LDYIELKVDVLPDFADIVVAELAEVGFDSFVETPQGVNAYVPADVFDELQVQEIVRKYAALTPVTYTFSTLPRQNWNEEWEKNYQPIIIGNQCVVRASFHQLPEKFPYEIVINPKMSFGTGHHETTALMLEMQLGVDHAGKRVLDAGCGTGILAIMACKRGAVHVDAYDIDAWAVENARENGQLNGCPDIGIQQGTIEEVRLSGPYGVILANINRNVLLREISRYAGELATGGLLLLSGFYEQDVAELNKIAAESNLSQTAQHIKQHWAALCFQKQG
jgi:ribosomal protein L11 methyltransferase